MCLPRTSSGDSMITWKAKYFKELETLKNDLAMLRHQVEVKVSRIEKLMEEAEHSAWLKSSFKSVTIDLESIEQVRAMHEIASTYALHPPPGAPFLKFADKIVSKMNEVLDA